MNDEVAVSALTALQQEVYNLRDLLFCCLPYILDVASDGDEDADNLLARLHYHNVYLD